MNLRTAEFAPQKDLRQTEHIAESKSPPMTTRQSSKTTAVRVIPAIGKKVGDELEFGGLLGSGPVMKVNTKSPAQFINRGGKIPAPLHSLKN